MHHDVERQDGFQDIMLGLGNFQLLQQLDITQRQRGLGFLNDVAQLGGAQQWHGGDRYQTGFDNSQPSQRHADRVAAAQ